MFVVLTLCWRETVLGTDLLMTHMNTAARKSQPLQHLPRDCRREDKKTSFQKLLVDIVSVICPAPTFAILRGNSQLLCHNSS